MSSKPFPGDDKAALAVLIAAGVTEIECDNTTRVFYAKGVMKKSRSVTGKSGSRSRKIVNATTSSGKAEPAPLRLAVLPLMVIAVGVLVFGGILGGVLLRKDSGDAPPSDPATVAAVAPLQEPITPRFTTEDLPLFVPDDLPDPAPVSEPVPAWKQNAVQVIAVPDAPRLVIILDDMGLDSAAVRRAAALPGPITLSFLPYARNLPRLTAQARSQGHELMVHVPMEPRNPDVDPGPHALLVGLEPEELRRRLAWNLDRFEGFVGINNHMGSRFTGNQAGMTLVMKELRARGLLFIDSRTTDATLGVAAARAQGVVHRERDVFLDHERTDVFIRGQLALAVARARRTGVAVVIGHPYPETLSVLGDVLPQLVAQGIVLAPVSAVIEEGDPLRVAGEAPIRVRR
ncbi:MAG: divergent polysaccharide deacetylase family protein [Sphingomonadales bacterium]